MVLEHAIFPVKPGQAKEFEAAWVKARAVIIAAKGCKSVEMRQGIESPDNFMLLVEWETLEEHMQGFRQSPAIKEFGALLAPFLVELGRQTTKEGPARSIRLADAVLDMLEAALCEQLACDRPEGRSRVQSDLMLRTFAFIEQNLGDPGLDGMAIAAAQHISIRQLQRLFESDGRTVTEWIRNRRIEHCRKDLANAELVGIPVSAIGARWGLVNAAHFSRLFKAAHGLSPREYRVWALS